MKTAMQEMIEYLENTWYVKEIRDWEDIKINILEKEKEQLCNAYTDGLEGPYIGSEDYYNQTYTK